MKIIARDIPPRAAWALEQAGVHPLLARLYAARGVLAKDELDDGLARLLPPAALRARAKPPCCWPTRSREQRRMCIVADYDCDGATACAVAVRGLRLLGAQHVDYLVPDRVVDGYGLTPPIAERVQDSGADLLITVDNGIASVEGVAAANALRPAGAGHRPPPARPAAARAADVIVNPNQPGCDFESKCIAGVGVMFYVLLALRAELRARGVFDARDAAEARRAAAAGRARHRRRRGAGSTPTTAAWSRRACKRIRAGRHAGRPAQRCSRPRARKAQAATTFDLGFALGPRINAAGPPGRHDAGHRMPADRRRGARRRTGAARSTASTASGATSRAACASRRCCSPRRCSTTARSRPPAICVFDPDFHEGVVGIVASRIKDRLHRPAFVFAASQAPRQGARAQGLGPLDPGLPPARRAGPGGQAPSRRAAALRRPRDGGRLHRGARSTSRPSSSALAQVARGVAGRRHAARAGCDTDGPLAPEYLRVDLVDTLHREVWGQGFAPPIFSEEVEVVSQRLVGEKHLALS